MVFTHKYISVSVANPDPEVRSIYNGLYVMI